MSEEAPRARSPWLSRIVFALSLLLLFAPLFTIVVYSFLVPRVGEPGWHLGMEWYEKALARVALRDALFVSLEVAFGSSLIACTLGTLAAIAIDRYDFPGRRLFHVITMMPLVLPELVMGLMCLLWFATLRITLGTWSIVCAHVTFSVSYVLLTVRARLVEFDHRLELAAQDLGARPGQVLWHITIPLVMPAALAGGMMAFTLSFDDFLISFFTAGTNADTLPIKLYGLIKFGLNREIYAVSTLLLAVTLSVVLIRGVVSKGKNYF